MFNKYFICILVAVLIVCEHNNKCQGTKIAHINKSYDFSEYTIVHPKLQHRKTNQPLAQTRQENGLHLDFFVLKYVYNNSEVIIDLELNNNLIPEGHFLRYQTVDGGNIVKNLSKTEINMCHYHGTIRGSKYSQVSISTCNGIEGIILDDYNEYHIQPSSGHKINSEHILYKYTVNNKHDRQDDKLRLKRSSTWSETLGGPYNSNKESSYIELVIVVDNDLFKMLESDVEMVHDYTSQLTNILNSLYVPLNIFIALKGVVVWTHKNEISFSQDGNTILENFANYRTETLIKAHPNDNAQLLTTYKFDNGTLVGLAYINRICTDLSVGLIRINTYIESEVAATMAHELGHSLGMDHDTNFCECIEESCIMERKESLTVIPRYWSTCSIDQLDSSFKQGMNYCLKNKPEKLFQSQSCGNGFVEPGEQCDCGLAEICDSLCCDPDTCLFHMNASCATGECCDLSTCQIRNQTYECRPSEGECDLSEYCNGESEYCPNNAFKRNTVECGNGEAYCYNGLCQSHTDQCKLLWGPSINSVIPCFVGNTDGSDFGNCGLNKLDNIFIPCEKDDILCGLLHCNDYSEELKYGNNLESIVRQSEIMINGGNEKCKTAIFRLTMGSKDPGLTPDGAKCGENKMCLNQKCLSIEDLRQNEPVCPEDCNGNGVCDSLGECRCVLDFEPPTCKNHSAKTPFCPENCNGNGECSKEGVCRCFWGFDQPSCHKKIDNATACPSNCNGNGHCNNHMFCDCFPGYLPPTCKNLIDGISDVPQKDNSRTVWFYITIVISVLISISVLSLLYYMYKNRLLQTTGEIPYSRSRSI